MALLPRTRLLVLLARLLIFSLAEVSASLESGALLRHAELFACVQLHLLALSAAALAWCCAVVLEQELMASIASSSYFLRSHWSAA